MFRPFAALALILALTACAAPLAQLPPPMPGAAPERSTTRPLEISSPSPPASNQPPKPGAATPAPPPRPATAIS